MARTSRTLNAQEVQHFYGTHRLTHHLAAFYENPATEDLIRHADLRSANFVFEFGCGGGQLAERILRSEASESCRYHGVDSSSWIVDVARRRLQPWSERASVERVDPNASILDVAAGCDRFVSTYVLDLLSPEHTDALLEQAHQLLLRSNGRLCLAGLTWGRRGLPYVFSRAWHLLFRLRPMWVGGCRPIELSQHIAKSRWRILHHRVLAPWAITSEVLIAQPV